MRQASVPVRIKLSFFVLDTIATAAAAAHPRETGGLLLGWWTDGAVIVTHAVEVADPDATGNTWSRHEAAAQRALEAAQEKSEHPWLGYVGDWHSHPAPCGASEQDLRSIKRVSTQYPHPMVLLVHRSDGTVDVWAAHCGRQQPLVLEIPGMEEKT